MLTTNTSEASKNENDQAELSSPSITDSSSNNITFEEVNLEENNISIILKYPNNYYRLDFFYHFKIE